MPFFKRHDPELEGHCHGPKAAWECDCVEHLTRVDCLFYLWLGAVDPWQAESKGTKNFPQKLENSEEFLALQVL
jgi:hypothetical protein